MPLDKLTLMNKIKEVVGRNKRLFALMVFLFFVALVCAVFLILAPFRKPSEEVEFQPVVVQEKKIKFELLNVTPPSGSGSYFDYSQEIVFEFTKPVDEASVKISAEPEIEFRPRVWPDKPNMLYLQPLPPYWKPYVEYEVVLEEVASVDGESFGEIYKYNFYNEPPEYIIAGDNYP